MGDGEHGESVRFLPGLFKESLKNSAMPTKLALVHLDADSYESISDALEAFYPLLSPGAVVIIDDWHVTGARRAVLEHRLLHEWNMPCCLFRLTMFTHAGRANHLARTRPMQCQ